VGCRIPGPFSLFQLLSAEARAHVFSGQYVAKVGCPSPTHGPHSPEITLYGKEDALDSEGGISFGRYLLYLNRIGQNWFG
jgi:hypothetical protein